MCFSYVYVTSNVTPWHLDYIDLYLFVTREVFSHSFTKEGGDCAQPKILNLNNPGQAIFGTSQIQKSIVS